MTLRTLHLCIIPNLALHLQQRRNASFDNQEVLFMALNYH